MRSSSRLSSCRCLALALRSFFDGRADGPAAGVEAAGGPILKVMVARDEEGGRKWESQNFLKGGTTAL